LQANAQRLEAAGPPLSLFCPFGPLEGATIDAVPADYRGTKWIGSATEETTVRPWSPIPSAATRWRISILARRIPKRRYADDLDVQKVLAQAPYFGQKFTLRAGGTRMRARAAAGPEQVNGPPCVANAVSSLVCGCVARSMPSAMRRMTSASFKQRPYDQNAHEESHDSARD